MRLVLIPALAAAILCAASPALAADKGARPAAPAAGAASADPVAQLIAEVAQYNSGYQAVLADTSIFFSDFINGLGALLRAAPADRAKADVWLAQMRVKLDALHARRAALGPPPASLLRRLDAAGMGQDAATVDETVRQMGAAIDSVLDLCDKAIALAPDALKGDETAGTQLVKVMKQGTRAALQSENAMMTGGLAQLPAGHPQGALLRSILASNTALMALMELGQLLDDDPKADPSALVKTLQDNLVKARTEAMAAGPLAQRVIAQIKASPGDEVLKARMIAAMSTYAESGQVETQLVGILEALLQTEDPAKAQSLNEELQGLVRQRLKLQADRQAVMAG